MVIKHPSPARIGALRKLWSTAFGDTEEFLDAFFGGAFAPERCLCISEGETAAAALYWFDCLCEGRKLAYIYAVATHPDHRGKGLCRRLMAQTHAILARRDYAGALLVPQDAPLRKMYANMGYRECTRVREEFCAAADAPVSIRRIGPEEYAALRSMYLSAGGVVQEGENLRFLSSMAELYAGEDFLLAAAEVENVLWGMELLGSRDAAPGILKALGFGEGTFRIPGDEIPFAMYLPLSGDAAEPSYFGLAFD